MASVGGGFGGASGNNASMSMLLKPRKERKLSVPQIIEELRPKISQFSRLPRFMTRPSDHPHRRPHVEERL